ncbi:VOC family protein [Pseudomonas vancouverensis]|uniref:Extradiol ring-cleavage dioxygenase n=1 Tax=Pseudomonas vancouverensis TaxID=95300 RepID=A0A1H2ME75_PSEVA|nr:VOC family protein [Pseudomonas vancouverensis]KAB0499130.1 extradiol ring-cleavage dioxygenase [Pseudomonas vancouverensis]TDB59889.1 extradiol ring-cleavage dioxygenase [Pseudomonas vancouverensis]SDU91325.1 2,3-dihydroxybiphenyl 1,2-dioxygenase [Pseudomonas vancouverensis]
MANRESLDIFGASSMGYAVIESNHLESWRSLFQDGIGLHLACDDEQAVAFRMDSHQRRIIVQRGRQEDFIAVGWQLRDQETLTEVLLRLKRLGIQAENSDPSEAAQRGVKEFWRIVGPKGMAVELFWEPLITDEPLTMLNAGFITGIAGMGHLAITSRKPQQMRRFWQEIFDARDSDHIVERIAGLTLDIDFLRVNERHHSIAIARLRDLPMDPVRTRIQHMNLLTISAGALTDAFLRCRKLGFEMAHEIGEHPNDREQSFYVMTPCGFEVELGWNALVVDEAQWQTTSYQGISLWGHRPEKTGTWRKLTTNLGNFGRGVRSLLKPEYSPL